MTAPQNHLTERIRELRDTLLTGLVERDDAVRLALLAALAGEHLLLIGPPGTAKSMIARRLHLAFADATYFERLLTRFTVPEELFGPLSIKGLELDRYERLTASYLPSASVAFLDEIFKANSAILNALLTLLNEREFDNGTTRIKTPLIAVVGASNELPQGAELDALYDRFLLRLHVGPVSADAFKILLTLNEDQPLQVADERRLSVANLSSVRSHAQRVTLPNDVVALLSNLREWCSAEEIPVSDRRWRKIVKLLRISAASNGRDSVSIWDCWLLQHCLWNLPEERAKIYDWYSERVGASATLDPSKLTKIVISWEARLKTDQDSKSQMMDENGQLLYIGPDDDFTTDDEGEVQARRGKDPLFLAPTHAYDPQEDEHCSRDRTRGGKGYTAQELDRLILFHNNHYNRIKFHQWSDREKYLADRSNWHLAQGPLPPVMEPTRHKSVYIEACTEQIAKIQHSIEQYQSNLADHTASLRRDISEHLWVRNEFFSVAGASLSRTSEAVGEIKSRMSRVLDGFRMLPNDSLPPPAKPAPAQTETARPRVRRR